MTNPKFICPDNLAEYHRELSAKITKIKRKEEWKKYNSIYKERTIHLQGKSFKVGNVILKHLDSIEDIYKESQVMNHCLFSNQYYKKERLLLFRAYYNGIHTETVSISLGPNPSKDESYIEQALGRDNKPSLFNDFIKSAVNTLMKEIYNTYRNKNGTDRKTRKLHVQAHGNKNAMQLA